MFNSVFELFDGHCPAFTQRNKGNYETFEGSYGINLGPR